MTYSSPPDHRCTTSNETRDVALHQPGPSEKSTRSAFRVPTLALLEASLTMAIWGSSFVVAKVGLRAIGPLTLAGLRYFVAFLMLLPFLPRRLAVHGRPSRSLMGQLALLGIAAYLVGNGCFFLALKLVPSTTVSFLMGLIPLLVLAGSLLWLKEDPTWWQAIGMIISLSGTALFFLPGLQAQSWRGFPILGIGILGFGFFGLLSRSIARERKVDSLTMTAIPLAVGGGALLTVALPLEGLPRLTPSGIGIVLLLALVNTAVAYLLYNHALQSLTALQMNLILNLSPFVTALLAAVILGEKLTPVQWAGMVVAAGGVALAQRGKSTAAPPVSSAPLARP
jgi:drug/metabolite transporter (DMT)-like permease